MPSIPRMYPVPNDGDPLAVLDELVLRPGGVEFDRQPHRDGEHGHREAKGEVLSRGAARRRAAGSPVPAPAIGTGPQHGQPRARRSPDPRDQDRRDQQRGAAEHRKGVGGGRTRSATCRKPFRRVPDQRGQPP